MIDLQIFGIITSGPIYLQITLHPFFGWPKWMYAQLKGAVRGAVKYYLADFFREGGTPPRTP